MKIAHIMDGENRVHQISMHRWFWRSVLLFSLLVVGGAVVSVRQYMEYADLYSEHRVLKSGTAELHTCLERKRELKEKVADLQMQCSKINGVKYRPKIPTDVLTMLQNCSSDVVIQEIVLKKKKGDLILLSYDTQKILAFADCLRTHEVCTQADVVSMEQAGDRIKALVRFDVR